MVETVYDVFARKNRGEPLHHVGYLNALDDELARIYAWKTYDEESWFEMCVVRRANIIPVNLREGPFVRARGASDADEVRSIPAGQPYGGES
jgi:1,2-phenylacetyl-CoA epoxidase PaaB subunit